MALLSRVQLCKHTANLNAGLDWREVFQKLEFRIPLYRCKNAPFAVNCPLPSCKKRKKRSSHIFRDRVCGGWWFYCHCCNVGMDLIELAARALSWSIERAARHLIPDVTDEAVSAYILQYVFTRRKANKFWNEVPRLYADTDAATADLLDRLRIKRLPGALWRTRMDAYASVVKFTDLDFSLSWDFSPKTQTTKSGLLKEHAMYCHRKDGTVTTDWAINNRILIAPCRDLPGRICGFYVAREMYARDGKREVRELYWRIKPPSLIRDVVEMRRVRRRDKSWTRDSDGKLLSCAYTGAEIYEESGHVMDYALVTADIKDTGSWCFILLDPLLALQMQSQHLSTHVRPLPVVGAWCNGRAISPWYSWETWRFKMRTKGIRRKFLIHSTTTAKKHLVRLAAIACIHYSTHPVNELALTKPRLWLHELTKNSSKAFTASLDILCARGVMTPRVMKAHSR